MVFLDAKPKTFHGKYEENKVKLFLQRSSVYVCRISLGYCASNLVQIGSGNCSRDSLKSPCVTLLHCELYGIIKMHNSCPLMKRAEGQTFLALAY
jgi:hypothetical protein